MSHDSPSPPRAGQSTPSFDSGCKRETTEPPLIPSGTIERGTSQHCPALRSVLRYGRLLTDPNLAHRAFFPHDAAVNAITTTLCGMHTRCALLVGPSGSGKSALIRELAQRIVHRDVRVPSALADVEFFELDPVALGADLFHPREAEERFQVIADLAAKNQEIVLVLDSLSRLLDGPLAGALACLERPLADGAIRCLACITEDGRRRLGPDTVWSRRFSVIRVDPPTPDDTQLILTHRKAGWERHFDLLIPEERIPLAVSLSERWQHPRGQPGKAMQLLDRACAICATASPPRPAVDTKDAAPSRILAEEHLAEAFKDLTAVDSASAATLTVPELRARLHTGIVGQDAVIDDLAQSIVARLRPWTEHGGPRGVFLFAGPTGVGKTHVALELARALGRGRNILVRVDCNTLAGGGGDNVSLVNRLLGAPPGFVGHREGRGGLLSSMRELTEAVLLFDEIEKAPLGLADLLLQAFDEGFLADQEGNVLDFRWSFILLTTNAGSDRHRIGMRTGDTADGTEDVHRALRDAGLHAAFLARISRTLCFGLPSRQDLERIVRGRLEALAVVAEKKGMSLGWTDTLVSQLLDHWEPRYGVRHLTLLLQNRVEEQLALAEVRGDLEGVSAIELDVAPSTHGDAVTRSERNGTRLVIGLA